MRDEFGIDLQLERTDPDELVSDLQKRMRREAGLSDEPEFRIRHN